MKPKAPKHLLDRYLSGETSSAETEKINDWLDRQQYPSSNWQEMDEPAQEKLLLQTRNRLLESITLDENQSHRIQQTIKWPIWMAAAILLLICGVSLFWLKSGTVPSGLNPAYANDINPGKNRAILRLDDGTEIPLDDSGKKELFKRAGIRIIKTGTGQIRYETTNQAPTLPAYHTIITPRGGQYEVLLPDSSRVWLNAGSLLKFPSSFKGSKTRTIALTGEAYFEVAHHPEQPFNVITGKQTVRVLGTHFNITAYQGDDNISTTLLQGSVAINTNGNTTLLKPGEQASFSPTALKVREVNAENVIAWKKGKFSFEDENISDIMARIARWYDVEIIYDGQLAHKNFSGSISRFSKISQVLDLLESTNTVHFKIEGRRVTVMP